LIDARHGLKATDEPTFKVLGSAAVSYQVVLTKADEIKPSEIEARVKEVEAGMAKYPSAFPTVLATSSETGFGLESMRAAVARLLNERKG
ncbi:MAG: YihA family ribosome biogenesis GTP-binding protein, partial [Proteobacteria bacterium]|nr:YihA family ribosome biogenesis GTP-binding protein [Pseudomonadota bacterium]